MQGLGPRFALEAGFLIAVAIAAGVAQLSATAIVLVMALAWVLVCLFELTVWAEGSRFRTFRRERSPVVEDAEPEPPAVEPPSAAEPVAAAADAQRDGEPG